jgi:hypothetical protein
MFFMAGNEGGISFEVVLCLTSGGWPSLLEGFFCVCSLVMMFLLSTWTTIASQPT